MPLAVAGRGLEWFREMTEELFDRMPMGYFVLGPNRRVQYANNVALDLAGGLTLDAAQGRQLRELFPSIVDEGFERAVGATAAGETVEYEQYFPPTDRWLHVIACPTPLGLGVFVRDISGERRARHQALALERLVRGSLDAMRDPFAILRPRRDEGGHVTGLEIEYLNRAARDHAGLVEDDAIGRLGTDLFPGLEPTGMADAMARVAETGEPVYHTAFPVEDVLPTGVLVSGFFDVQFVRFDDRVLAVWRDVTDRERQHQDRERLARAMEQTSDAVLITDTSSRVVYVNDAFEAMVGEDSAHIAGRSAVDLAARFVDAEQLDQLTGGLSADGRLGEVDVRAPDGSNRRVLASITPLRQADGEQSGWLAICRDISELRAVESQLRRGEEVRTLLVETLTTIPTAASLQEAAQQICDRLLTLSAFDVVLVQAVAGDSLEVVGAATAIPTSRCMSVGDRIEPARVSYLLDRAKHGAWSESWAPGEPDNGRTSPNREGLVAAAYGPIKRDGEVVGLLVAASADASFADVLLELMPDMIALTAGSSALLAERLERYGREVRLREQVDQVLAARSFHPVFQPIVDLDDGSVVGYEALSRFEQGVNPDAMFQDAWTVGRGPALELAALSAAIKSADALPAGRWLSVNVSPSMVTGFSADLNAILEDSTRPTVLEITEHVPVDDYEVFRAARQALGAGIRFAVDDAGAGVANFRHIVELRPDFVKLDISLVRGVHKSLSRQALVRAMVLFAQTAGCRLIAEGVETQPEARALVELGVEFGQGYRFGRPAPVEQFSR